MRKQLINLPIIKEGQWIFHKNKNKLLHILINVFTKTLKVCSVSSELRNKLHGK